MAPRVLAAARRVQSAPGGFTAPVLALVTVVAATAALVRLGSFVAILVLGVVGLLITGASRYSASSAVLFVAWGAATFTTEAALSAQSNDPAALLAFTPAKLVPLAVLGLVAIQVLGEGARLRINFPIMMWLIFFAWLVLAAAFSGYTRVGLLRVLQGAGPLFVVFAARRSGRVGVSLLLAALGACAAHVVYGLTQGTYVGNDAEARLIGLVIANAFGFACGMTVILGIGLYLRVGGLRGLPFLSLSVAGAVAMLSSRGRTAALALPVAIAAIMFRRRGGRVLNRLILGFLMAGVAYIVYRKAGSLTTTFTSGGNTDIGTLSGRTTLWHELLTRTLSQHPVLGWGPGTFRVGGSELTAGLGELGQLGQAHNSLIEALVAGGVIGAALWLVAFGATLVHAWRSATKFPALTAGIAASMVVFAITIGNLAGFGMAWYVLLALLALPARSDLRELQPQAAPAEATPAVDRAATARPLTRVG